MSKHKLYRQFENTSPLTVGPSEEISMGEVKKPSTPNAEGPIRCNSNKNKSQTNEANGNKKLDTNMKISELTTSEHLPDAITVSDYDSDFEFFNSYYKPGAKSPYTAREDEWILKYMLKGQNLFKAGSISLWKHLESKKESPKRTYHSLKNRFLRTIKPHLFTRYGHLITSDKQIKKILTKFPELKSTVGRRNTLSGIQLPARNPNSKLAEGGPVNKSRDNNERVTSPSTSTSDGQPSGSAGGEPTLNLNFSNFERKVTITGKSVSVCVNYNSKQLQKPITPPIGIYEHYEKFMRENKLVLCSACGRYNLPRKKKLVESNVDGESLNFKARRQVLTANSSGAEPGKCSVTNSESPPAKNRKVRESEEVNGHTPASPSLLRDAGEEHDLPVVCDTQERPLETGEVGREPQTPSSVALKQQANSVAVDRSREADDDLNSTYNETVIDFMNLIKNEEERSLAKKCLYGTGGVLGLSDSISEMSMESYFVDLSPNLETPMLTIDCPSQSAKGNSYGLLARNMMKMWGKNKTSEDF